MIAVLVFYKAVDKSALHQGISIPVSYQKLIMMNGLGETLNPGDNRAVKIEIDGAFYDAVFKNQTFDRQKYDDHPDIVKIRYGSNSPLAKKLREKFAYTELLIRQQIENTGSTHLTNLNDDEREFIAVYTTNQEGVFSFDCISNGDFHEEANEILSFGEAIAENILEGTDSTAGIVLKTKVCKIRKLSKSIGDSLKKAYGYRCQICGRYIGESYGSTLIHAHHIDYFTRSFNNDASNIMIVCPNHHGIIHDRNPQFVRNDLEYIYPNGFREKLKLNIHL